MDRNQFLRLCGSCAGLSALSVLVESCGLHRYYDATIEGSHLVIPMTAFEIERNGEKKIARYVVAQNDTLEYPVCVFRDSESEFTALLMRCTHQGTELQVFGDRLQCPAHGSEFTTKGLAQNGPADTNLRRFKVLVENDRLKIDLS